MSDTIAMSNVEARRFYLRAHGLIGPKLAPGIESVRQVIDRMRLIQVDSINVAGTNQEISLNSRIDGFIPDQLYSALYTEAEPYGERIAFEYYQKCLCILQRDAWPYYSIPRRHHQDSRREYLTEHRDTADQVLARIRDEGPLMPADFDDTRSYRGAWGMTERVVKRVMETLWETGELVISGRKSRMRIYDLASRHFPLEFDPPSESEYQHRALLDVYSAMRLVQTVGATSQAWQGVRGFRRDVHADMLHDGEIVRVQVEGMRRELYMLNDDVPLLNAHLVQNPVVSEGDAVRLIAPLDSAVWDRNLVRDLFGFDVTFEVYKPATNRVYGYYCLPILYRDCFVGRVDIARDTKSRRMKVESLHWEAGFDPFASKAGDVDFLPAFARALDDHRRFMALEAVMLPRKRSSEFRELRVLLR
jgi:uncharacterized protein